MGRQAHLERLVLGRSAYQDEVAQPGPSNGEYDEILKVAADDLQNSQSYKQQYDSKGRPINPATESRNQAMRDAQNGVLAVVGVVEAKESADNEAYNRRVFNQAARRFILKNEQLRGELLDLVTSFLRIALAWWPSNLVQRIQIGLYPRTLSFADILTSELATVRGCGIINAVTVFLAGAPSAFLYIGLKLALRWCLEQCVGRLQTWVNGRFEDRTFEQVNTSLMVTAEVGFFAIDAALLPIQFYATTQWLGLSQSWPLLPTWTMLLPWNAYSMHSLIWNSTVDTPWVGRLCSPAVLLLFQNWLKQDQGLRMLYRGPISNDVSIDEPYSNITQRDADEDWFDGLLRRVNTIHFRIMKCFGWKLQYIDANVPNIGQYENDHIPTDVDSNTSTEPDDRPGSKYRSTALSQLPAQYLSERIYESFECLITLPLDSLVLRAVADAYTSSAMFRSSETLVTRQLIYLPFGGGPLTAFRAYGFTMMAWHAVGSYMSRLGLSLALNSCVETAAFFTAYGLTRWQGIRNFGWGSTA